MRKGRSARFHQAVAQGTERVGLAGAGQPEGQHVDAALDEAPWARWSSCCLMGRGMRSCSKSLPQ